MPELNTFNKLIRDRIPEIIRSPGADCGVMVLDEEIYRRELFHKLVEEASEARETNDSDHLLTEISDVREFGCSIDTLERLPTSIGPAENRTAIESLPILCRVADGDLAPRKHSDVGWFSIPELKSLDWSAEDIPILDSCHFLCSRHP